MSQSDVARLREQIALEYEAAQRGLSGLAYGASRHDFIVARIEAISRIHDDLNKMVGEERAIVLIVETLEAVQTQRSSQKGNST